MEFIKKYIYLIILFYSCSVPNIETEKQDLCAHKSQLPKYNKGDLFFGFSEIREKVIRHPYFYKDTKQNGVNLLTIDSFNSTLLISDQMKSAAKFDNLINWIKDTSPYTLKQLEKEPPVFRDFSILWFEFLKKNIDYIDVRNIILNDKLNMSGVGTKNKFYKNIYNFHNNKVIDRIIQKHGEKHIENSLNKWAKNPKSYYEFKKEVKDIVDNWVYVSFFRRTSKLALDFANENQLNVFFSVGHKIRKDFLISLSIDEIHKDKKSSCAISGSELRHCFRKGYHLKPNFHFLPFDLTKNKKEGLATFNKKQLEVIGTHLLNLKDKN